MSLSEHLEKLRHFHKLASFQSINAAARSLGVSQAGLSKSLKQLEEVLGVELFTRSHEGLLLTHAGELTLETSKFILEESDALELKISALQKRHRPRRVRIGMYDSIAVYLFTRVQRYFSKVHPDLTLELTVDRSGALASAYEKGELDIAIGVNLPVLDSSLDTYIELYTDSYSFYSSPAVVLNDKSPVLFHPLATDQNGSTCESLLKTALKGRPHFRIYNFESVKSLTDMGLGIGVLPMHVARPLVEQKRLKQMSLPKVARIFGLHRIGMSTSKEFQDSLPGILKDVTNLVLQWSKK